MPLEAPTGGPKSISRACWYFVTGSYRMKRPGEVDRSRTQICAFVSPGISRRICWTHAPQKSRNVDDSTVPN